MTGDDQVAAHGLLATCCQIAAGVTVMAAAEQSGDQLCCASAAQFASWIYRRQGRYDESQQVATRAAERYEPRMSTAEPAQLSIWGGLLVEASGAAARANRPTDADDLLAVAAAAAARLGEDRWDRWSVFGPRLVAQTRVINACEMGDYETACRAADQVPEGRLARDVTLDLCERAGSRRSALLDRMVEHLKLVPTG